MERLGRTPRQIGAIIRDERRRRQLTQGELGDLCGLRQETISIVEGGADGMRLDSLLAITAALGLELRIAPRAKRNFEEIADLDEEPSV